MRQELQILKSSIGNIQSLRNEVYQLERQLLQEQTKKKALQGNITVVL